MTPEQQKAIALANARKRKAEAMGAAPAAPPMSTRDTERFPPQEGLGNMSMPAPYPQRAGDLQGVRDYLSQSQAEDDARAAERKALETSADAAAAQAGQSYAADAMFLDRTDRMSYQERARQNVWDQAGIMSPEDAFTARAGNSALFGLPGLLNEGARGNIRQAGQDQPGSALLGDVAGYLVPGEALWQAGKGLTNAFARPIVSRIMPQGGSAIERGTRFAGRYGTQAGAWAGQNALYQGTVGESVRASEEGRDPSLGGAMEGAAQGATDPLNLLGPAALMGLNRLREFAATGGRSATPRSVAESVAAGRGAPTSGSVLDASRLGGGDVDRRAETLLLRMLRNAGFSGDDVRRGLAAFDTLADETTDLPVLASRLKDVLIDQLGPGAEQVVQDFLQGAGVSRGGTAGQAVADAAQQDYGRLSDFLEASANARLGAGSRFDTLTGAQDEMTRIGNEGYERVFGAAPTNQAGVDDLRQALDFYANSELATPLRQVAAGRMLNVEQMIEADPRRAAHWMQYTANLRAQEAADAGNEVLARAYRDMRDQILRRLEADGVAPGYQQARMQFGDQFGIEQAVNFGSRFFTRVQDTVGVRRLADDLRNLTPEQQEAALLSIRDELLRLAGRGRRGAAPRLTQLNTDSALGGLETVVGERGGQLANDIRFIDERLARIRRTDQAVNSRTASNQEAREFADRAVSNPITRTIGNAINAIGGDAALASVASGGTVPPVFSIRAGMRAMGDRLARGRQGKIDDVTALLLRDYGNVPRPGMPGDDLPALTSRSGGPEGGGQAQVPNAFSQTMSNQTVQRPSNAFARDERGVVGAEMGATLGGSGAGGVGGYAAPAEDEKTRLQNAMFGAAAGLGLGIQGARGIDDMVSQAAINRALRAEARAARIAANDYRTPMQQAARETGTNRPEFASRAEEIEHLVFTQAEFDGLSSQELADTLSRLPESDLAAVLRKRFGSQADGLTMSQKVQALVAAFEANINRRVRPQGFGGYSGERASGFVDDLERPSETFNDPRLTATQNKVVEMARNGFSNDEIAEEMATTASSVATMVSMARKLGIEVARGTKSSGAPDTARVLELAQSGVSPEQIAARTGKTPGNVAALLSKERKRYTDRGEAVPEWLQSRKPRITKQGLGNAFAESALGSAGGSALGSREDLNGDGVIDEQDVFLGAAGGAVGVPAITGGMRAVGNAFAGPKAVRTLAANEQPIDQDRLRLLQSIRDPRMMTEGDPVANARMLDNWQPPGEQTARPMGLGPGNDAADFGAAALLGAGVATGMAATQDAQRAGIEYRRENAFTPPTVPPVNPMASENAVARTYGNTQPPLGQQDPDDPRNFGLESFEDLPPNDPLRDPWFRREMIKRGLREQAARQQQLGNAFARAGQ